MSQLPSFDPELFDLGSPRLSIHLCDEQATRALGRALASVLERGDFLGLIGHLGAGKTTLVQGLVQALSPPEKTDGASIVHSPTYTLINHYPTSPPIQHMDLYRLERYDDLESIGYWDVIESGRYIACVEWFSNVPESWPEQGLVVELSIDGEGRRCKVWWSEELEERLTPWSEQVSG